MKVTKRRATGALANLMANINPTSLEKTRNKMLLAAKIADAMRSRGLSQKQMATEMDKTESEISEWLSGDRNFTVDTLTEIEGFFGIRLLDTRQMGVCVSNGFIDFKTKKKKATFVEREYNWHLKNQEAYITELKAGYRIVRLDEVKYRFNFDYDYASLDKEKMVYQFSHMIDADKDRSEIIVEINVRFMTDEAGTSLAEQGVRATFAVNPYDGVVGKTNGKGINIHAPELIDTFANVTIGALRGMIAKNLKGTPIEDCVLPLISMDFLHTMMTSKE